MISPVDDVYFIPVSNFSFPPPAVYFVQNNYFHFLKTTFFPTAQELSRRIIIADRERERSREVSHSINDEATSNAKNSKIFFKKIFNFLSIL